MKKVLLIIFLVLATFTNITGVSFAQESQPSTLPAKTAYPLNTNPDVPQNFHTYTQSVFIEILAGATCIFSGVDILSEDGRCLGIDTATKKIGYVDSSQSIGLIEVTGNLIGATYNMPASSGTYAKYLASNFGITNTTYAQSVCGNTTGFGCGIGFEGLEPVLNIWRVFRNLAYLAFVLIFVIIGLGIMFRLNIDARAVMSVQNQLPKIILALVLITMSYAIAGFMIDMMYLSIYLMVNLFASNGLATVNNISNPYNAAGSLGGISNIAEPAAESVVSVFVSIFDGSFGNNVAKIVTGIVGGFLGAKAGGFLGMTSKLLGAAGPWGAAAGIGLQLGTAVIGGAIASAKGPSIIQFVAGIIVYLVIMIAILSALFRVWFLLIKTYIFILLDVIFAPFFIMAGLLPGSPGGGFSSWFRSMLGNLAAFPTVLTLFLVGAAIQNQLKDGDSVNNFIPPLVGSLSDDSARSIGSLIGLGIILIMPESVNIAKSMFKSPERKLASAIWEPIGKGQGTLTKFIGNPIQKSLRKESDGTRGFLRGALEDTAWRGLERVHLGKDKLKKMPIVGGIMKHNEENMRRRREHLQGTPSHSSGGSGSNNHSSNDGSPSGGNAEQNDWAPSEAQVKAEAEIRARGQGLDPENLTTDEDKQKMEQIIAQARNALSTPPNRSDSSQDTSIAQPPRPGDGSGNAGASRREVHEELLEHQGEGSGSRPASRPGEDPTASAREAGEQAARDREKEAQDRGNGNGGSGNPPPTV